MHAVLSAVPRTATPGGCVYSDGMPELACPYCLGHLSAEGPTYACGCGGSFPLDSRGRADFRITAAVSVSLQYAYDPAWGEFPWHRVQTEFPEVPGHLDGSGLAATEAGILRSVPAAGRPACSLDLGCGREHQRFAAPLAKLGYRHTGVDIDGPAPDYLADLHALPFKNESFDLLVTTAVFEHLKQPHVAMAEAARICREGGLFVGSIAFGEPFHVSYFHHSPLAVQEVLESTGFEPEHYVVSADWNAFKAHLEMGYAGARWPRLLRSMASGSMAALGLAPAYIRSRLLRQQARWQADRLAFARSHTALVGFVARRRGPLRTLLNRPIRPHEPPAGTVGPLSDRAPR